MKTVDGNYSYDELEGFEPFVSERQYYGDPILTIREGMLNLNKAAADIVCRKKYIRFYYNEERKMIMVTGTDDWDMSALQVTKNKKATGFSCRGLSRVIESVCKYDTFITMIKILGKPAKTKRDALIFDLTKFSTSKIQRTGKRSR